MPRSHPALPVLIVLAFACGRERAPARAATDSPPASAIARNGAAAIYVSNEDSRDLTVIDAATDSVVATIPVGTRPRGVHVGPDGRVYVAVSGSPKCPPTMPDAECAKLVADRSRDGIAMVDVAGRRVERMLPAGSDPENFAVSADGARLFISNEDANAATIVDVANGKVVATVPVGREPEGVGVRPGGHEVWVTGETDHDVTIFDAATGKLTGISWWTAAARRRLLARRPTAYVTAEVGGTLSIVDARARRVSATIAFPVGAKPMGVVVAPDGSQVYVTTGRGGTLAVVDPAARRIVGIVPVGPRPWGIAISADGRRLYTANGPSGDVSVVDVATLSVVKRIPVGTMPWGVAVGRR
jgi:40-residue YVTN family beta-propeller repeat